MSGCLQAAIDALASGISVWPPRQDGSKAPDFGSWKSAQSTRATEAQILEWYKSGRTGVGWVTGQVSGNLEVLDFDDRSIWAEYQKVCHEAGVGDLLDRVTAGYFEHTPNGAHLVYRCEAAEGNKKLAHRKNPNESDPNKWKARIETRGEGGYIVVAPSHGSVHPSNGRYVLQSGGPSTIVRISHEERQALFDVARTFDEKPPEAERELISVGVHGQRPGDDFNERATWEEILEPHGWVRVSSRLGATNWRRPGKDRGISATTNYAGSGLFYVFSTSTDFDAGRGYSKFSTYTRLNHGGDFAAAAHALALQGYGGEKPVDGVDISLLLSRHKEPEKQPLDSDLLRVPGMVGELADWINATSHKTQPMLALGASISAVATIIGRKVRTRSGLRSNIYVLGVAPSGTGKERAREAIRQVFDAAGAANLAAYDSVSSDAAINNALGATPACLLLLDEAGREFAQMLGVNAPPHIATIVSVLLKLYGASATTYYGKTYADAEKRLKVDQPCLSIYGTTVPRNLYSSMTPEQVNDGFLGRFLVFESDDADPEFRDIEWQDPPVELVEQFARWHEFKPTKEGGNLEQLEVSPRVIEITPKAADVFNQLETDMRRRRYDISGDGDDPGIFMRVGTAARKLALIRACGISFDAPEISEADAVWGTKLAGNLALAMAAKVKRFAAESKYEADMKRVLEIVNKAKSKRGITKAELIDRTKWLTKRTRDEILAQLEESGAMSVERSETRGRPATKYLPRTVN